MNYSLYIHIPFCRHRCAYCDFNTYAGQEDSIPAYVDALLREIEFVGSHAPQNITVHTVFFGGGTPSLLAPSQLTSILTSIRHHFASTQDAEITMEANPGTVAPGSLAELRQAGVNRISFGAQSANGEELRLLERSHTFLDVIEAVRYARQAGFENLNLDLIYGLPEQAVETWKTTVGRVLDLQPQHISAYALTLEHGTPFGRWSARGLLPMPDPDAAAEMYEWASGAFEAAGYGQYEISNWGLKRSAPGGSQVFSTATPSLTRTEEPEFACRHNLQYWRCEPYLGFGAGAHGYAAGYRYSNALRIKTYIERIEGSTAVSLEGGKQGISRDDSRDSSRGGFPLSPAAVNQHRQTAQDEMSEFMIMGLRLTSEGVSALEFEARFGRRLTDVYGGQIAELKRLDLLECVGNDTSEAAETSEALRLTRRGRLLGNQVFLRFV